MNEIRIHGRGGQGSVMAAEIMAKAAVKEDKHGQSFPMFGPERRGAPVQAFARIDDKTIRVRGMILEPDIVLVLDPGLIDVVDVTEGLKANGTIILNTPKKLGDVRKKLGVDKIATINATKVALDIIGRPITNTSMLGAFSKVTGLLEVETLKGIVKEEFPGGIGEKNADAIQKAYEEVKYE